MCFLAKIPTPALEFLDNETTFECQQVEHLGHYHYGYYKDATEIRVCLSFPFENCINFFKPIYDSGSESLGIHPLTPENQPHQDEDPSAQISFFPSFYNYII